MKGGNIALFEIFDVLETLASMRPPFMKGGNLPPALDMGGA